MSALSRKNEFTFQTKYASSFKNSWQRNWAKLLAVLFDYGYVYLIRSTRQGKSPKFSKYKIGKTYDLRQREQSIDRSVNGSRESVVFYVRVFFCGRYERKLHRRFKKRNFVFEGSGKTEWFKLTANEAIEAGGWMKIYKATQQLLLLLSSISLFAFAYLLHQTGVL